jgi:Lon protease-like protein
VFEPRYRSLVEDALATGSLVAVPRLRPGYERNYHGAPPVFEVCGVGRLVQHEALPDGRYNVLLRGLGRIRLLEETESLPYRVARAELLSDVPASTLSTHQSLRAEVERLTRRQLWQLDGVDRALADAAFQAADGDDPACYLAGMFVEEPSERQALLEERDATARLVRLLDVLKRRQLLSPDGALHDPLNTN